MNDVTAARTSGLGATLSEFEEAAWRRHWEARELGQEARVARIRELISAYLADDELDDALQALAVELVLYRNDLLAEPITYRLENI